MTEQKIIITIEDGGSIKFDFEPEIATSEEEFNKLEEDEKKVQAGATRIANIVMAYLSQGASEENAEEE
jgi:hypothetical protein